MARGSGSVALWVSGSLRRRIIGWIGRLVIWAFWVLLCIL
jgi:hypothetical protein